MKIKKSCNINVKRMKRKEIMKKNNDRRRKKMLMKYEYNNERKYEII